MAASNDRHHLCTDSIDDGNRFKLKYIRDRKLSFTIYFFFFSFQAGFFCIPLWWFILYYTFLYRCRENYFLRLIFSPFFFLYFCVELKLKWAKNIVSEDDEKCEPISKRFANCLVCRHSFERDFSWNKTIENEQKYIDFAFHQLFIFFHLFVSKILLFQPNEFSKITIIIIIIISFSFSIARHEFFFCHEKLNYNFLFVCFVSFTYRPIWWHKLLAVLKHFLHMHHVVLRVHMVQPWPKASLEQHDLHI